MESGGADGMVSPSSALTSSMMCCDIGVRRSHPHVSMSASRCVEMTGRRDSAF